MSTRNLLVLFGVVAALVLAIFGLVNVDWESWVSWTVLGLVVTFVLTLLVGFVRLLIVREGKVVSFEFLGEFAASVLRFTNYHFDAYGSVIDGPGPTTFRGSWLVWPVGGGLVFYVWPLVRPVPHRERNDNDGFGEGYDVHLNEMQEELVLLQAETTEIAEITKKTAKKPKKATGGTQKIERRSVSLNIKYLARWRVKNPYLYLYRSPKDAKKQAVNILHAILREWVGLGDENHAQATKGNGIQFWKEITNPKTINAKSQLDSIDRWGLEIIPESIVITDVGYDPEYQAALKAKRQQEFLAEGEAAKLYDPVTIATAKGIDSKDAVELRKMSLAGGKFSLDQSHKTIDIVSGGKPIDPNFAGIMGGAEVIADAVARAMGKSSGGGSGGGSNPGGSGGTGGTGSTSGKKEETLEEYYGRFEE